MLVKVYPYKAYDISKDCYVLAEHYATEECISLFNTQIIATECYYVEVDDLDGDGRILKTTLHEIISQNSPRANKVDED